MATVTLSAADDRGMPAALTVSLREDDHAGAGVFGDDHVCITALDGDGREVGRAVYQRVYGFRAELTLDVDEALWHTGLPELLVTSLSMRAARVGIATLLARVAADDIGLLALLRGAFAAREVRDGGHVEVEFSTAAPRSA